MAILTIMVIIIENEITNPNLKSWTGLFVFHFELMLLGKGMNPFFLPLLWTNGRED